MRASAEQISFYPCAANVMLVTLITNVDIVVSSLALLFATTAFFFALACTCISKYAHRYFMGLIGLGVKTQTNCVNADGRALSFGDMPRITITGLANYLGAVTFDDSTAAPFDVGEVGWAQSANGDFVITVDQDVAGQTAHTIKLKMRNKASAQVPLILTIGINTFTNSPVTITNGNVNEYKPGYIVAPTVNGGAGVTEAHQSTDNPCATNTITVSIVTNVPVYLVYIYIYIHIYIYIYIYIYIHMYI